MAWASWELDPLLIEADPAGGVLGHRFNVTGSRAQRNLQTFAVDTRRSFRGEALANNVHSIAGIEVILAPVEPERAELAVSQASSVVSEHLAPLQRPIIADLGRVTPNSPALRLLPSARAVLVLIEPQVDQIQAALYQIATIRRHGIQPEIVIVGKGPFAPAEIADVSDSPIAGELPKASEAAVALCGGRYNRRAFSRSPLWRSIAALAREYATTVAVADGDHVGSAAVVPESPAVVEEPPPPPELEQEPPVEEPLADDTIDVAVWRPDGGA